VLGILLWNILLHGFENAEVQIAYEKFLDYYRNSFDAITDRDNAPKNPGHAEIALKEYAAIQKRRPQGELLATEISATVAISERHSISGRIDSIRRMRDIGIIGDDYKTGMRYSTVWYSQWKLNIQMHIYNHMLASAFFGEKVYGMIVDGVILYKNKQKDMTTLNRFVEVPVRIQDELMSSWLFDINYWMDTLEWNMKQLSLSSDSDKVLEAFPKNTESCTMFNKMCPYHTRCTAYSNPLQRCDVPGDFEQSFWDHEKGEVRTPIKHTLDKEGIKPVILKEE